MNISSTAVIVLCIILFICVLPPLGMIYSIIYMILRVLPFQIIPFLLSFWRGLVIIIFLSSDITFFILSDEKKSLIPWSNKAAQIAYVVLIFVFLLMNGIRYTLITLEPKVLI
jgi:hypothetical protein